MGLSEELKKSLIHDILEYGAVKFGNFTLKSGIESPIYMDIRVCVSHPSFLKKIAGAVEEIMSTTEVSYDHLCGVPYTALPIATCVSTKIGRPMIMRRKEAKNYGTKQIIEGKYAPGDKVLIIEDIVTSGSSILETVNVLKDVGLHVTDAVVLIDREQGGSKFLADRGIRLHSVLRLTELIDQLEADSLLSKEMARVCRNFIQNNRPNLTASALRIVSNKSFEERLSLTRNDVTRKLLKIVVAKKTNLCVAIDVSTSNELFRIIEDVGPFACAVKTHVDILEDFNFEKTISKLRDLAIKHSLVLFEDRKFADIGKTVQMQYSKGLYRISDWADIVTVHGVPGDGVIKGLSSVAPQGRSCLLVAEMSSAGNLTTDTYKKACADLVTTNSEFAIGVVSQSRVLDDPDYLQFTPGVQFEDQGDHLGQQYVTPEIAIRERGADIVIVGRGICSSDEPDVQAQAYARRAWKAYLTTVDSI